MSDSVAQEEDYKTLEHFKNFTLKEIFDFMEEYLIEVHMPFMLRSVDDKTGKVVSLSIQQLEEISRKVDFISLLQKRIKIILSENKTINLESFTKRFDKLKNDIEDFKEIFLKIEDRDETYFVEIKGKMERIFEDFEKLEI